MEGEQLLHLPLRQTGFSGKLEVILIADKQYYKTLSAYRKAE